MATYYWVGGAGTWNGTNTANWSTGSGGAGGAGPPTTADDVIFDNNSDSAANFTVTCTAASAVCNNFTVGTGASLPDRVITFSGGASVYGSFTAANSANNVFTSFDTTYRSTTTGNTVTFAGRTYRNITVNGAGGEWTQQDNLTLQRSSSTFTLTAGKWITNNKNVTAGQWNISGTSTRALELGSSTIQTEGNASTTFTATTITNLTFDAGTSTINFVTSGGGDATLNSGGLTFYNVAFLSTTGNMEFLINGANTFNNLTITGPSSTGQQLLVFGANQTINGTLTCSGATAIRRVRIVSDVTGTQRTLTVATCSPSDADFRDIVISGVAAPLTGTRLGNFGNCSGITFTAAANKYWNLAGSQNWTATGWALTETGTPATNNFPLPQDDVFFTNNGAMGTVTINASMGVCNNLDMSARTNAATLTWANSDFIVVGNATIGTGVTLGGTGADLRLLNVAGSNRTLTTNGVSLNCNLKFDSPNSGKITFAGNVTTTRTTDSGPSGHLHRKGELDLNGKIWTTNSPYYSDYTFTRSLTWGNNAYFDFKHSGNLVTINATGFTQTLGTGNKWLVSGNVAGGRDFGLPSSFGINDVIDLEVTAGSGHIGASLGQARFKNVNLQGWTGSRYLAMYCFGNFDMGTTCNPSGSAVGFISFQGNTNTTANFRSKTLFNDVYIDKEVGSALDFNDSLTLSAGTGLIFYVRKGTLNTNNHAINADIFDIEGTDTKVLNLGTSTVTLTRNANAGRVFETSMTGTTLNASSATFVISGTANLFRTFGTEGSTFTIGTLTIGGGASTGEIRLYGNVTLNDITTTRTGAWPLQLFNANTCTFSNFSLSGSSGNLITFRSSSTTTKANVVKSGSGNVCVDYLICNDIAATPANTWYVGANSTDGGDNTGLIFTACPAATATGNFLMLFN